MSECKQEHMSGQVLPKKSLVCVNSSVLRTQMVKLPSNTNLIRSSMMKDFGVAIDLRERCLVDLGTLRSVQVALRRYLGMVLLLLYPPATSFQCFRRGQFTCLVALCTNWC